MAQKKTQTTQKLWIFSHYGALKSLFTETRKRFTASIVGNNKFNFTSASQQMNGDTWIMRNRINWMLLTAWYNWWDDTQQRRDERWKKDENEKWTLHKRSTAMTKSCCVWCDKERFSVRVKKLVGSAQLEMFWGEGWNEGESSIITEW